METCSGERRIEIIKQLLNAVDLLAVAVGSGRVGFDGALCEYVEHSEGELSRAFAGVLAEMSTGVPRLKALTNMAKRFDVPEVKTFICALVRADLERISLVETLRSQARQLCQMLQAER